MDFFENHSQALFYVMSGYSFFVVILHAPICPVVHPKVYKLLRWSSVPSQGLQNNCMLVIKPVIKSFKVLKHLMTMCVISVDVNCVKESV